MAGIERLTVSIPADMATSVKDAVAEGAYVSTSEVGREALRDWHAKRVLRLREMEVLKADIDKGLADVAAGRVCEFDTAAVIERGRRLLATRSSSD